MSNTNGGSNGEDKDPEYVSATLSVGPEGLTMRLIEHYGGYNKTAEQFNLDADDLPVDIVQSAYEDTGLLNIE